MLRLLCAVFDTNTATCALLTGECIYLVGACGALWPTICPDRWVRRLAGTERLLPLGVRAARLPSQRLCRAAVVAEPGVHARWRAAWQPAASPPPARRPRRRPPR
jgi:hypothetical protein